MYRSGAIVDDQGKMNNFAIEPEIYVQENPRTGFTPYAEMVNGRLAMIGFISLLAFEAISGRGLISFLTNL
ncbi:high light inducible protein [Lyngbya aestuarii]|uniref:high light inducible protein n=1 Tax=Lyngbya aestuarii TaxID=118322 RepID=UPI00403D8853